MRTALYPGSCDPVTAGHLDILTRASRMFDRVIVGVLHNPKKPSGAFSVDERLALLSEAANGLSNVEARAFSGLLVDAARACGADVVVRGIRGFSDVEIELQMARLNLKIGGVETVFLAAAPEVSQISAGMVREIARLGGNVRGLVPETVRQQIIDALTQRR